MAIVFAASCGHPQNDFSDGRTSPTNDAYTLGDAASTPLDSASTIDGSSAIDAAVRTPDGAPAAIIVDASPTPRIDGRIIGDGDGGGSDSDAATSEGSNTALGVDAATAPANSIDTIFDVQPPALNNQTSPTFQFHATRPARFKCRKDSGVAFGCVSPLTIEVSTQGHHSLSVAAISTDDDAFDTTPAMAKWTLKTAPPTISIASGPSNPTQDPMPSFQFSGDPSVTFTCSLDGSPPVVCSSGWAPSSPLSYGNHTFTLTAVDAAGNTSSTNYQWNMAAPIIPVCGNGVVEPGEQCDDGNPVDNDGCSNSCIQSPRTSLPFSIVDMSADDAGRVSAISQNQIACLDADLTLINTSSIATPAKEPGYLSTIRLARGRTSGTSITFSKYVESDNSANFYLQYFDAKCNAMGSPEHVDGMGDSDSFSDIDADGAGNVAVVGHTPDYNSVILSTYDAQGTFLNSYLFPTGNYGWGVHVRLNPIDSIGVMSFQRHSGDIPQFRRFDLLGGVLLDVDPTTCGGSVVTPSMTCLSSTSGLMSDNDSDSSWYDSTDIVINADDAFALVQTGYSSSSMKAHFYDKNAQPITTKVLSWPADQYMYDTFRGVPARIQVMGTDYLLPTYINNRFDRVARFDEAGDREGTDAIASGASMQTLSLDAAYNTYRFSGDTVIKNDVPLPGNNVVADPIRNIAIAIDGNQQNSVASTGVGFGVMLLGDPSVTHTYTITNNGELPVTLTNVSGSTGGFQLSQPFDGANIAAGDSLDFVFTMPTTTAGYFNAQIQYSIPNDYYNSYSLQAGGEVLDPAKASYDYSADWDVDDSGNIFAAGSNYNSGRFALVACVQGSSTTSALGALVPSGASVWPVTVRVSRSGGHALAVFTQSGMPNSADNGIFYQLFDANCKPLTDYRQLLTTTDAAQFDLAADSIGGFTLAYWDPKTSNPTVMRLDSNGAIVSTIATTAPVSNQPIHVDVSPSATFGILSTEGWDGPTYVQRFNPAKGTWIDAAFLRDPTQQAYQNAHKAVIQDDGSFAIMTMISSTAELVARFYDSKLNFLSQSQLATFTQNTWSVYGAFQQRQLHNLHLGGDYLLPAFAAGTGDGPYVYGYSFMWNATVFERFSPCGTLVGAVTSPMSVGYTRLDDAGDTFNWYGYPYSAPQENQFTLPTACTTCSATCSPSNTCGDGVVGGLEVCDDGNTKDGDNCAGNCLSTN